MYQRSISLHQLFLALTVALFLMLGGCSPSEATGQSSTIEPVRIEAGDECHICGMVISRQPGPKGEFVGKDRRTYKFCSTHELFFWLLQPENQHLQGRVFVHDMARADWNSPDDSHLTDARTAWYVIGSSAKSGMGPTIASFKFAEDAQKFIEKYRGRLVSFEQITLNEL
ncbi:nitrous oxide reductase accessory protein NosL [Hahella ganghwensis]|uniref:nitrous oxide reductase accessory protein NosL n=1 Tax=Hahella ganghwensis TaxID=286420 RepID=UPI0004767C3C|nr:nitrous oxide reductase accessory protein NosL [Hahella ganghwensis]